MGTPFEKWGRHSLYFSHFRHNLWYYLDMPRTSRKKSSKRIYHVMDRSINKQLLFFDESDYLKFLYILGEVKNEFKFEILSYCLMSNHYHLLIFDAKNNMAKAIAYLNARYAKYYNKKNNRFGYVFGGRFRSEAIETEDYLLKCIRYIHQNPVKANICKNTHDYKFTSIHAYRSEKGNNLKLVSVNRILDVKDKNEFLKWNEINNEDKFLEIINNKISDQEVLKNLYKYLNIKSQKEYSNMGEERIVLGILKLIDDGIPLLQISRISGLNYLKVQRLKKGEEGKVVSLTYVPR